MEFEIGFIEKLGIKDHELTELLNCVYVSEGYTPPELAETLFSPSLVRARGTIIVARERVKGNFAGMVIVVHASSPARVMAAKGECEMHLLAVKSEYRGFKLGRGLVEAAIAYAKENNWAKMILWTQISMVNAHRLYRSCGFEEVSKMKKNETVFLVFEKDCTQ